MISNRLTGLPLAATSVCMSNAGQHQVGRPGRRACGATAVLIAGAMALSGCISVNAPNDAIVIELNINIKQEVIYRLAADAENTIEENADIF